ncbi:MAG TPA: hypothetical protein VHD56_03235, partial [Tepidisphaeraceae bacterium]|nr:hypothetical protein [Tepidisphaeraceae bacterium]
MFRVGKSKLKALAAAATLAAPTVSMAQISATWTWNQQLGTFSDATNWFSATNSYAQQGGIATLPVTSISGSFSSVVVTSNVTLGG